MPGRDQEGNYTNPMGSTGGLRDTCSHRGGYYGSSPEGNYRARIDAQFYEGVHADQAPSDSSNHDPSGRSDSNPPWVLNALPLPYQGVGILVDKLGFSPHFVTRMIQYADGISGILLYGKHPGMQSTPTLSIHDKLSRLTDYRISKLPDTLLHLPGSQEYAYSVLYLGDIQALKEHQEKNGLQLFKTVLSAPLDKLFPKEEGLAQKTTFLEIAYSAMSQEARAEAKSIVDEKQYAELHGVTGICIPLAQDQKPLFANTQAVSPIPQGLNLQIVETPVLRKLRNWWKREMITLLDHSLDHPQQAPLFTGEPNTLGMLPSRGILFSESQA